MYARFLRAESSLCWSHLNSGYVASKRATSSSRVEKCLSSLQVLDLEFTHIVHELGHFTRSARPGSRFIGDRDPPRGHRAAPWTRLAAPHPPLRVRSARSCAPRSSARSHEWLRFITQSQAQHSLFHQKSRFDCFRSIQPTERRTLARSRMTRDRTRLWRAQDRVARHE